MRPRSAYRQLSLVVVSERPVDAAGRLVSTDATSVRGDMVYFTSNEYFSWSDTRMLSDDYRAELLRSSFGNWCDKNGW